MARAKAPNPAAENSIEPAMLRVQPEPANESRKARDEVRVVENGIQGELAIGQRPAERLKRPPLVATLPPGTPARDTESVPESVRERFMQVKEKFYFPNGDPAFRDLGTKLTTKSENAEIVRSLVAIARARGWEEVTVGGTKEFKRAVWHEAALHKLEVRGYTPTEIDEARLVRTMAGRRDAERETTSTPPLPRVEPEATARRARSARDEPERSDAPASKKRRVFYGTLLAHGADNFQFNPQEDMNYYLKVKTDDGKERFLWGKDLERALRDSKSQPNVGDRIGVVHAGQESVTVPKKELDNEGRVLREWEIKTHRNEWTIESEAFFRDRARLAELVRDSSIDARRAAEQSPALAGTYVTLKGAERFAEKNFADPHDQKRFVETIRRTLAREIKSGAPLYAPAMRDREVIRERGAHGRSITPEISPLR
jgi:hypothetical protein